MKDEKLEVKETTNYNMFRIYEHNRPIDKNRADKLAKSMLDFKFIIPIIVNSSYFIIDGQHRYYAAKKHNIPIKYIIIDIEDSILPLMIASLNSDMKQWSWKNYLNLYSSLDLEQYKWIKIIMSKYKLSESIFKDISKIGNGFQSPYDMPKFKEGAIVISEQRRNLIIERITNLRSIVNHNENFKSFNPSFERIVAKIVLIPEYNHERMMGLLDKRAGAILNSTRAIDFIIQLEDFYNYKLKEGSKSRIKVMKKTKQ